VGAEGAPAAAIDLYPQRPERPRTAAVGSRSSLFPGRHRGSRLSSGLAQAARSRRMLGPRESWGMVDAGGRHDAPCAMQPQGASCCCRRPERKTGDAKTGTSCTALACEACKCCGWGWVHWAACGGLTKKSSTNKLGRVAVDPQSRQEGACFDEEQANGLVERSSKILTLVVDRGNSCGGSVQELVANVPGPPCLPTLHWSVWLQQLSRVVMELMPMEVSFSDGPLAQRKTARGISPSNSEDGFPSTSSGGLLLGRRSSPSETAFVN